MSLAKMVAVGIATVMVIAVASICLLRVNKQRRPYAVEEEEKDEGVMV